MTTARACPGAGRPGPGAVWCLAMAMAMAMAAGGLGLWAGPLAGGSFVLTGSVTPLGGAASGGAYVLAGGAPAQGAGRSEGGGYDLIAGLLPGYGGEGDGPRLHVAWTAHGQLRLWWSSEWEGYVLESAAGLEPESGWQPVAPGPAGREHLVAPVEPARYFRLRRP